MARTIFGILFIQDAHEKSDNDRNESRILCIGWHDLGRTRCKIQVRNPQQKDGKNDDFFQTVFLFRCTLPKTKNTSWKLVGWRLLFFWEGLCSGAIFVLGRANADGNYHFTAVFLYVLHWSARKVYQKILMHCQQGHSVNIWKISETKNRISYIRIILNHIPYIYKSADPSALAEGEAQGKREALTALPACHLTNATGFEPCTHSHLCLQRVRK